VRPVIHLVIEGHGRRMCDEATLQRASAAFKSIYD
jgi:hypothetical protein